MQRFLGMMPTSEIEKSVLFRNDYGDHIYIDAGPNGWTIRYPNRSYDYQDYPLGTDENFNRAYEFLKTKYPNIEEIK